MVLEHQLSNAKKNKLKVCKIPPLNTLDQCYQKARSYNIILLIYSRCHTETGALQLTYKHAHQTHDMLNKAKTKVENIIRK